MQACGTNCIVGRMGKKHARGLPATTFLDARAHYGLAMTSKRIRRQDHICLMDQASWCCFSDRRACHSIPVRSALGPNGTEMSALPCQSDPSSERHRDGGTTSDMNTSLGGASPRCHNLGKDVRCPAVANLTQSPAVEAVMEQQRPPSLPAKGRLHRNCVVPGAGK
jgi:hypothetical protein